MPVAAAIYARISQDSEQEGLGVSRQLEDCRAAAVERGWEVVGEYVDNDVSATRSRVRPEYQRMIEGIKAGHIKGLIVWDVDRLTRTPRELEDVIDLADEHRLALASIGGEIDLATPQGRLTARIKGSVARHETDQQSRRVKRKMLEIAEKGERPGGPIPFGYRLEDGKPVIVEEQAEEIRRAYLDIVNGRSIGSIVKGLNARKVRTARGGLWTSTSVRGLILRPANAGFVKHQGKVLEGIKSVYPPIVSEEVWRAAVGVVTDPSRLKRHEDHVRHLLSGLIRCGACGDPMRISARAKSQRGESGRFYYKCARSGDGHSSQTAEPLELFVSDVVVGFLCQPEVRAVLQARESPGVDMEALRAEESALQVRMTEAAASFAEGLITGGQLREITQRVRGKIAQVQGEISRAQGTGSVAKFAGPGARERWESTDVEGRRAVIAALVDVYVDPVKKAAPRVFDPGRVRFEWRGTPAGK
jgi:site-specific DNA recombinase